MTRLLALDVGKTGCRAALFADGVRVTTGEHTGASGIADPDGPARALAAITAATAGWPDPDGVAAGLAGLGRAGGRAAELADGLRARFRTDRILLTSDMTTSHAGALGGAPGVVLAAGTGAVALAVSADGRSTAVDGWGYLLGDEGSGFAIGRAGLACALGAHDGRGGSDVLLARLRERYGDPDTLPARVHGTANPAREVAAFARDVVASASAGDLHARHILDGAAVALADTAAAATAALADTDPDGGRAGPIPVACLGGLLDAGPSLTGPLDRALADRGLTRVPPDGDALDGARLLLEDPTVPHHALLAPAAGPR